jgi:hypothetical protein
MQGLDIQDLLKRIDQLLNVLNMITKDLADISESLKTHTSARLSHTEPKEKTRAINQMKRLFPRDLGDMLTFQEDNKYVLIKPRRYLGADNFSKIASIIREAGGEYISAGKESHFRIQK